MSGDHVALLHARPFVSWYEPLVVALPGYSVLRTAEQCPPRSDFGLGDDADVCARLLHHVGFDHPHVVGHSYGGCLALELARQIVALRSIALLEPATSGLLDPEEAIAGLAQLMELYRARGPVVAAEQSSGSSSATTLASGAGTGDPVLSAQRQQGVALAIEGLLGSKLGGAAWARGRWSNYQVDDAAIDLCHGRTASLDADEVDASLDMSSTRSSRASERRSRRRCPPPSSSTDTDP